MCFVCLFVISFSEFVPPDTIKCDRHLFHKHRIQQTLTTHTRHYISTTAITTTTTECHNHLNCNVYLLKQSARTLAHIRTHTNKQKACSAHQNVTEKLCIITFFSLVYRLSSASLSHFLVARLNILMMMCRLVNTY